MDAKIPLRLSFRNADPSVAGRIEHVLRGASFEIVGASPFGIDARASRDTIEDFFQTSVMTEKNVSFEKEPDFEQLPSGPEYHAYFPRKPQLF